MLKIIEVDTTSPSAVDRFVDLPYRLYANHPLWVPPLREIVASLLCKSTHPFYAQSDADFLLAERDGRAVARIALLEHKPLNQAKEIREAWFYLFECEPGDTEAATALFEEAFAWARRRGLTKIEGPRGFTPLDSMGLLVEGFEYPQPMTMMDYTMADYVDMIDGIGFQKERDIHSFYLSLDDFQMPPWIHGIADRVRQTGSLSIRHFEDINELLANASKLIQIYGQSATQNVIVSLWTPAEMEAMMLNLLKMGVDPRFIKGIVHHEDPNKLSDGTLVGAIFGFPDLSQTLQQLQGKFDPVQLQQAIASNTGLLVNGFGILPDYQLQGSNALMYAEIESLAREANMQTINVLHVVETTTRMQQDLAAMGIQPTQTHRVYSRMVSES